MGGGTHSRTQAGSQIGETGSFLGPSGVVERLPYQNEHPRYAFVRIVQLRRIYAGYNIIRRLESSLKFRGRGGFCR